MESVITLDELKRREEKKDSADRRARVKALTTEGLKSKPTPTVAKRSGGRVKAKGCFSTY